MGHSAFTVCPFLTRRAFSHGFLLRRTCLLLSLRHFRPPRSPASLLASFSHLVASYAVTQRPIHLQLRPLPLCVPLLMSHTADECSELHIVFSTQIAPMTTKMMPHIHRASIRLLGASGLITLRLSCSDQQATHNQSTKRSLMIG